MASGDVVNTAARLQSAAPVNGVLVDEATYRGTRQAVEFAAAEPVEAKGKAEPIAVWEAKSARARFGVDVAHEARAPLVGRDRELAILRDAFERARDERVPQLVTLVGVPGLGKSRLVYELSRIADADPGLVTWRQGRCLAYGDGVTLWALAEIVKAQAGIVEQDTRETAREKIHAAVVEALAGSGDETWVESHLLPLVGLEDEAELEGDRRGEAFSAWRRFLEGLAEQRTLVVVFEDLHWADEALLDFVDELVEWLTEVPLLVVATARPELLERRPGWGGGKLNATTLALAPLDEEQTALLIARLLGTPVLAVEDQHSLLERAGGNPLYAEQFADLYLERGSTEELALPETLQGLIAARVDGLQPTEKLLLQDAAVVGKVFWASALQGSPEDVRSVLHALERKGFVRRQKRSSVEGQQELAFAHALVRDVSYGQIARAERAEKHRYVAEWIADLGRPEDHAEMLAHHWRSALELAGAAGGETADFADRTRSALRDAGDRAYALNAFGPAEAYYAEAIELWPEDDSERPKLLFRRAEALFISADERREQALVEARDVSLGIGDNETAAEAEAYLSRMAWYAGHRDTAQAHVDSAVELIEGSGPTIAKAKVLAYSARLRFLAGGLDDGIRIAGEALAIAEALQLNELRAHAVTTIGSAKHRQRAGSGDADLELALAIATESNSPLVSNILNNLAVSAAGQGNLRRAEELYQEGVRTGERLGDRDSARFNRGNLLYHSFFDGRWDETVLDADRFVAECEASPHYQEGAARMIRAYIRLARGDVTGALADWERTLALAREAKDATRMLAALFQFARGQALLGHQAEAHALATEALDVLREHPYLGEYVEQIAGVAKELGIREEIKAAVSHAPAAPGHEAAVAAAAGDFVRAAELWEERGGIAIAADYRFHAARELAEAGRREEAEEQLEQALTFYRSVGGTFFIERGKELLAGSQRASA
jgi:predicted ATPase